MDFLFEGSEKISERFFQTFTILLDYFEIKKNYFILFYFFFEKL